MALVGFVPGCGALIGLDDYEISDGASSGVGGKATGGAKNTGGDTSSAGSSPTGGADTGGSGGTGGEPATCDTGCDDKNDCTKDSCVDGECAHEPLEEGTECKAGVCNVEAKCVVCLADKPDYTTDTGCNDLTPRCDTSSGVAMCKGCMTADDCNDLDDCTVDKCEDHWCVKPTEFLPAGTLCGDDGHACNNKGKCSDCWDTSPNGKDAGCQDGAEVCDISGAEPICTGCTSASDCDDGNDCTTQTCNAQKQCVLTPVNKGNACDGGICDGDEACLTCLDDNAGVAVTDVDSGCENTPNKPFCVVNGTGPVCAACLDTTTGSNVDAGCSAATPMCDTTGGGAVCRECMSASDCGDGVSCTTDSCVNHLCVSTPSNAACPSSGDVCKPNRCDATLDCKQVDISVFSVLMDENTGNGSVELKTFDNPATKNVDEQVDAVGWTEAGPFWLVYDCSSGCKGAQYDAQSGAGTTYPLTGDGNNAIWLGHQDTTGGDLNAQITIPANTVRLKLVADINFQTQTTAAANADKLNVWFENTNGTHIGSVLKAYQANSPASPEMQTGTTNTWTPDGLSIEWSAVGYTGNRRISFETTSVNAGGSNNKTSYFLDNIRITATVCQ